MRLYRTTAGAWAGTQTDAGKGFEQVEVPTDKPGLIAWLNERDHCFKTIDEVRAERGEPACDNITKAPPSRLDLTALGGGVAGVRARQLLAAAIGVEAAFLCDDHIAQAEARAELRAAIARVAA